MSRPSKLGTIRHLVVFPFFYLWEIVAGALRISWDVLHPRPRLAPILVRIPVGSLSPRQRLLLSNLVTMTPGTLSVDLLNEGETLVVHGLYDRERPAELIDRIKTRYQPAVEGLPI